MEIMAKPCFGHVMPTYWQCEYARMCFCMLKNKVFLYVGAMYQWEKCHMENIFMRY